MEEKKYYIARDYMDDEFNGEVLAVTTIREHAYDACHEREDDTDCECITIVKVTKNPEHAKRIVEEAIKRGDKPLVELD